MFKPGYVIIRNLTKAGSFYSARVAIRWFVPLTREWAGVNWPLVEWTFMSARGTMKGFWRKKMWGTWLANSDACCREFLPPSTPHRANVLLQVQQKTRRTKVVLRVQHSFRTGLCREKPNLGNRAPPPKRTDYWLSLR